MVLTPGGFVSLTFLFHPFYFPSQLCAFSKNGKFTRIFFFKPQKQKKGLRLHFTLKHDHSFGYILVFLSLCVPVNLGKL